MLASEPIRHTSIIISATHCFQYYQKVGPQLRGLKDWLAGKRPRHQTLGRTATKLTPTGDRGKSGGGKRERRMDDRRTSAASHDGEGDNIREIKRRQQQLALGRRASEPAGSAPAGSNVTSAGDDGDDLVHDKASGTGGERKEKPHAEQVVAAGVEAWLEPAVGYVGSTNSLEMADSESKSTVSEETKENRTAGKMTWSISDRDNMMMKDGDGWEVVDERVEEDGESFMYEPEVVARVSAGGHKLSYENPCGVADD